MSETNDNNNDNEMKRKSAEEALKQMTEELENLSSNDIPVGSSTRERWTEDNWEEEMDKHPFFTKNQNVGYESHPMVDALRQLKYDEEFNSKKELVNNYKEDGNENFRQKKYRWAVDSYSKAISINCEDNQLNSIVYNNRASAHYHLQNYRSSVNDAIKAFELDSNNTKALIRIVLSYFQLKEYQKCIDFCRNNSEKNIELLSEYEKKALIELKNIERNARKEKIEKNKRKQFENKILDVVKKRGIRVNGSLFESIHPAAYGRHVTLDSEGNLVWPVLFIYPEYGQSDFIEKFEENQTFLDHLNVMFEELPVWDTKQKYRPNDIIIGFNKSQTNEIKTFSSKLKLKDVLIDNDFVLESAIPTFILTSGEIRPRFD